MSTTIVLCNLCKENLFKENPDFNGSIHGLEAKVIGGYDSEHLLDGTEYIFNLCEKCIRDLFYKFKIKPKCVDYPSGEIIPFKTEQNFYEYKIWKRNGGFHTAFLNGKCNMVINCVNDAIYSISYEDGLDIVPHGSHNNESYFLSEDSVCELHKDESKLSINAKYVKFVSSKCRVLL